MPSPVPLHDTIGAAFIGLVLSSIVFGVTVLQVYLYYTTHAGGDRLFLKTFVAALLVIDAFHLALVAHVLYFYTIKNFGDFLALTEIVWSLELQVGVAEFLTCMVQGFFAWRIYVLSERKNWWLPALVVLTSSGLFTASIGFMVIGFQHLSFVSKWSDVAWTSSGLACELASDILITGGMTYYLVTRRTGHENTDRLISVLVKYTVNTGLLTTIFTIITLVFYILGERKLIYTPFFFILTRLYSCSFMSTLNTRRTVRDQVSTSRYARSGQGSFLPEASNQIISKDGNAGHAHVFVSTTKFEEE